MGMSKVRLNKAALAAGDLQRLVCKPAASRRAMISSGFVRLLLRGHRIDAGVPKPSSRMKIAARQVRPAVKKKKWIFMQQGGYLWMLVYPTILQATSLRNKVRA
jgi:hypothetical protein